MPESANHQRLAALQDHLMTCLWAALQHKDDPERLTRMMRAAAAIHTDYVRLSGIFGDDARGDA